MSAEIIDGKAFAAKIRAEVAQECAAFRAQTGVQPGLAVVLVGNDAASEVYVRNKGIQAKEAGFNSLEYRLPAETTQSELLAQVAALNADPQVHGILVQLPLPAHLDADAVLNAIAPDKDVDGFHPVNVGRLWTGNPVSIPCTPLGCALILKDRLGDLSGKRAIVIGRSNIVGKPMAALLLAANATVTIAHSRTADLAAIEAAGLRLGLSTHSVAELDRALSVHPSYVASGAIFPTTTKQMPTAPQGLDKLREYVRQARGTPVVAIGGIDLNNAEDVLATGVSSLAVVRAVTEAENPEAVVKAFQALWEE